MGVRWAERDISTSLCWYFVSSKKSEQGRIFVTFEKTEKGPSTKDVGTLIFWHPPLLFLQGNFVLGGFLRSNTIEQLQLKLEKLIGISKPTGKVVKLFYINLDLKGHNFDLNGCPRKSLLTKTIRNGKNIEGESQLPKGSPSFTETGVLEIQSTSQEIWQNINSQKSKIDIFKVCFPTNSSQSSPFFPFWTQFLFDCSQRNFCSIEKRTLWHYLTCK